MEKLFTVDGEQATPAQRITLQEAGLWERRHLQEWFLAHPELLGDNVMIITSEYGRWETASGPARPLRLDVLGLDQDGRPVVAELKRDEPPDTVTMQALNYAAMVSRFTVHRLAQEHARYRTTRGLPTSESEALERISDHSDTVSEETLRRPRIVLVASSFPRQVTSTAVWLSEMGLDITLVQVELYRTMTGSGSGGQVMASVSRLYPLPDIEDFTITPAQARAREAQAHTTAQRNASAVRRLVDAGTIADGTTFTFSSRRLRGEEKELVDTWLAERPDRSQATWRNDHQNPLVWRADGDAYLPTSLVRRIVQEAGGQTESFEGTAYWVDEEGNNLIKLAAQLPNPD